MSHRNGLVLSAALLSLVLLVACGSSSNPAIPPPSGGFSETDLNGTYVFSTSGTDANGLPIMIVGAFTACGCSSGTISGGAFSFDDGSTGDGQNQAITGGLYSVTADGRGQAHLSNSSALGTVTLDFVLSSSSGGSVAEYDSNGTGSGTLELQSPVAQSDIDGQSYAFSFSGGPAANVGIFSTAGAFTLDSSGAVSTGVQDIVNVNLSTSPATVSTQTALQIATSSSVAVGTGTSPGTAQISSTGGGTYSFDVYAVSKSHLKFIETDGIELISGDVFTQQSSLPSGTLAFVMAGVDSSLAPIALGGQLPTSNATITGGIEDYNDAGTANTTSSVSGSFSPLTGGRSVLTLNSFENGGTNDALGTYLFSAYPSTGGLLLLEIDNNGVTSGNALVQTTTSIAASVGYGLDLSAANLGTGTGGFEEDDIAEFTATSSSFTGLVDINDEGSTTPDQKLSGNYASQSTGRFSFTSNDFNGFFYTVDGSTVLVLETDSSQTGTGGLLVQSTPGSAHLSYAPVHLSVLKIAAGAHLRRK